MKIQIVVALITGIVLGLVIAHLSGPVTAHFSSAERFASLHARVGDGGLKRDGDVSGPASAMSLMQSDSALCDQPYFIEVYDLSVAMFSGGIEKVSQEEYAEAMFDHARHSGHFTAEQAEGWILHIKDIPGQFVEIFREDPTVLDSCYNFQVAAVGPP